MERAGTDRGCSASRGSGAIVADRKTHHRRFSVGSLDPAGQHHDPRAGHDTGSVGAARVRIDGERAAAVATPAGFGCRACARNPDIGGSQETATAEATRGSTRSTRTCSARCRGTGACSRQRVKLPKSTAGR
jgi:hypothetical protein